VSERVLENIWT